jgi:DNA-binding Xre family transcriptional regulator
MPFTYNNLWKLLIDKGMTKEDLRIKIKASPTTIASMGKNHNVSLNVIDRICQILNCEPSDIMEYVKDK